MPSNLKETFTARAVLTIDSKAPPYDVIVVQFWVCQTLGWRKQAGGHVLNYGARIQFAVSILAQRGFVNFGWNLHLRIVADH